MIDRGRLRVFAQEVSKQIEYDLLAGASTVYALTHQNPPVTTSQISKPSTRHCALDDMLRVMDELRSLPPTPVAIWLVDRPDMLPRILKEFPLAPGPEGQLFCRSINGVRIMQVDSVSYDPEIHPPWCVVQGCYVEMSDGNIMLLNA